MSRSLDRELPRSPESEQAFLGSILTDASAFVETLGQIDVEDFALERHQTIYRAMASLARDGRGIDLHTVKAELVGKGLLDEAGGSVYVSGLVDSIPDFSNVASYGRIIADKAQARRVILACREGEKRTFAGEDPIREIASSIANSLSDVSIPAEKESRSIFEVMTDVHKRSDERAAKGETLAIKTGFWELDDRHAIRRKALIVVAAPSGHGKSAFELNLALNIARNSDSAVVSMYSLEMSDQETSDRFTSMLSKVPHSQIRNWKTLSEFDRSEVDKARESLRSLRNRFFFSDRIRSLDDLYADCRKRKLRQGRLDAVFVDYLQLVHGATDERTREREVNVIARRLFELAIDLDCAVVAASQVNKDRQQRKSGRMLKTDLKEASAIGEHARVVIMFQRPWEDAKEDATLRQCYVDVQVEKNNEGRTGDFEMHFDPVIQTFGVGDCERNRCSLPASVSRRFTA